MKSRSGGLELAETRGHKLGPVTGSEKGLFLAPIGAVWHASAPLESRAKNPQVLTHFAANWRQFLALIGAKSQRLLALNNVPNGANSWSQ